MDNKNSQSKDYFLKFDNSYSTKYTANDIFTMTDGQVGDDSWIEFNNVFKISINSLT